MNITQPFPWGQFRVLHLVSAEWHTAYLVFFVCERAVWVDVEKNRSAWITVQKNKSLFSLQAQWQPEIPTKLVPKYRLCGCISTGPSSSGLFMRVWLPQPVIRQLDIAYFEPSKSFDLLSCSLLITKPVWCQLDNWNIKWVETWLVKRFWPAEQNPASSPLILEPMLFSTFANTRKGEWSEISAGSRNNSNLREQWACWKVRLLFRELGWAGRSEGGQESHEFGKGKCRVLWLGCDKPCSTTG